MTTVFPDEHDIFSTIPAGTHQVDVVGGRTHRQFINDHGDAIEALQGEVGSRGSGVDGFSALVNGGLDIWQAGTSVGSIANGVWVTDNWIYRKSGGMVHDASRSTDVPSVAQAKFRASYSLHLDVIAASGAIASGNFCTIATRIEGSAFRRFAEQLWSIGFWVKAAKTGRHYVYVTNSGEDRSCVCAYDIGAANTWEYKIAAFPPSPTAGTWDYDTGRGLEIGWCLAAGATYHATTNLTWQSGLMFGRSDQVNETDDGANNFRIALAGRPTLGPVPARYRPVPIALEELRCWRYCYVYTAEPIGIAQSAVILTTDNVQTTPVPMRATPTVAAGATFSVNVGSAGTVQATPSTRRIVRYHNSAANWTVNALVFLFATVNARIP